MNIVSTQRQYSKKLSVIIPAYLEELMLGDLLSLFTSDLKSRYNLEIIVSDGGSTDKTVSIAKEYADIVVENTSGKKQNISIGRNEGARVATGDIFIFLNADCMPDDIEQFFNLVSEWSNDATSKYSAIACTVKSFPVDEKFQDKIFYFLHNKYVHLLNILGMGMGRGECQIVKKEVFRQIGGYNSNLVAGEDFDLYRRIVHNGKKILFSKQILINESPRRFRRYGYLKTLWFWTLNSITVMFFNKSVSKEWEPIR